MNDHNRLLILGGVLVALAPFVLIGIGIASDYNAAHPRKPHRRHHARNIVLGFAIAMGATVAFARLSHLPQAPRLAPVQDKDATGVSLSPMPKAKEAAPRAASPGASAATWPGSTAASTVSDSGPMTAFRSAVASATTKSTTPLVAAEEAATSKPPTTSTTPTTTPTSSTTLTSTVATTPSTRGATTTTMLLPLPTAATAVATITTTPSFTTRTPLPAPTPTPTTTTTTTGPPTTLSVATSPISVVTKTIVPLLDSVP